MSNKCLIILSYIADLDRDQALDLAQEADLILCADGGQTIARKLGIVPDCVIGDFDSTREVERFDCTYITYPAEKDLTDTEAAVSYAIEQGCQEIRLLGGIGGRLDHTLGNLALLLEFEEDGRTIEFLDYRNSVQLLRNGSLTLKADPRYKYFALSSVDAEAKGVSITGARYPLDKITLPRATTLGVSNEILAEQATITVEDGALYIVRSSDALRA